MSQLSYAIIGTGAVGGLYGARLQRSGQDAHFLLHSDFSHVRRHGLRIDSIYMNIFTFLILLILLSPGKTCSAGQIAASAVTNNSMSIAEANAIVTRAYQDILHRDPEDSGLETFTTMLLKEKKDETWLRKALRNSPEGRNRAREKNRQRNIYIILTMIPLAFLLVMFSRRQSTRDFIFKVILLTVSVAFACIFLEIFLRMKAKHAADRNASALKNLEHTSTPAPGSKVTLQNIIQLSLNPMIVYDLIPNLSVQFMGGQMKTGPDSFRLTPGSSDDTNAFCIIGLGDSVMFGWGVNDDETYLSCICRRLNSDRSARPVKVINMSVPGYNTVMELETLKEKGLKYHPDIVMIHFVENDLWLPNFICQESPDSELTRSYLLSVISQCFGGNLKTEPFGRLARSPHDVPKKYENMVGEKAYMRSMKELCALGAQHGFKVVLVTNWKAPSFVLDAAGESGFPIIELGQTIGKYCQEHDIKEFQGSVLTVSRNDPHYSALAHELVCKRILDFFAEKKLLPQKN